MIRIAGSVAFLLALVALEGCNSGYGTNYNVSACTLPTGMQAALVYPAPNSTGNSTSLAQVIVATSGTLPSDWANWDVELTFPFSGAYGSARFGNNLAPATPPFPTPNATPTFANPAYWSSTFSYTSVPPLPPGTVITATLNDLSSNCAPPVAIANFST